MSNAKLIAEAKKRTTAYKNGEIQFFPTRVLDDLIIALEADASERVQIGATLDAITKGAAKVTDLIPVIVANAKAEAWGEGWHAGERYGYWSERDTIPEGHEYTEEANPYRKEASE